MNTQEYISSGIVESYVLGLASDEERREFEQMCRQYPDVLEARIAFEIVMEKQAMQNTIAPAAEVRNRVFDEIGSAGKVVSMSASPSGNTGWLKYAAAACIILLAGSLYWNISLSKKNKELRNNYDNTVARLNEMENDIKVLTDKESVKMASMKGTLESPQSYTTVYWDTTSHDVYLLVNNLPKPADSLHYQLWALADGQPIDLGFITDEYFVRKDKLLIRAKNAQKAQAFAITLEKKDRVDVSKPAGQVYVVGKL
ncbi:MAG TPA: anti-sigma factor [Chitinophagaceae bacterium]|nr:anti-sigma factor [Chitinophagaceae bacterium]